MVAKKNVLAGIMFKPSVLLLGLLFLLVNINYDYFLYHINTYKILMLGVSVLLLYAFQDLLNKKDSTPLRIASWQAISLMALPTIATFPGYIWNIYQGGHNYNFRYELVTDLFLFLWAGYVFRITINDNERLGFFAWIVPLMFFLMGYSILEFYGLNPLTTQQIPTRPKATFGNINYFAGFLATLTPIFLILSLPKVLSDDKHYSLKFERIQAFFLLGFISLLVCAILAQSRAALGASFIASLIALSFWAFVFLRDKHKSFVIIAVSAVVLFAFILVGFAALNPELQDILIPGRFSNLFQENAWQGRTSPLIAASRAFIASPWIGWGLGSSYNLNFLFMPHDTELYLGNRSYNHVHNEFLEMSEEGGVLILLVWLILMLFIFWKLFSIAKNRANQTNNRLIAIGCIAGIMAFYGHGVFSVAQRMIVANLPLYSLLGVAFGLIYSHSKANRLYKMPQLLWHLPPSVWRFVPSSLLMLLAWSMFIPICISFYQMVRITPEMNTVEGVIKMEEHMKKWPNPYALDELINKQIELGRYQQAQESVAAVKKIIPEYRSLGYKEAALYFHVNDLEKAKSRLQAYQKRVGYDTNSITLLGAIALLTKDQEVFLEQLERALRKEVISRSQFDSFNNKDKVSIAIDNSIDRFTLKTVQSQPGSLKLTMSPDYLKELISVLSIDKKNLQSFMKDMANHFAKQDALIPPLKDPENLTEAVGLIKKMQSFLARLKQQKKLQREAYLRSTRPKNRAEQISAIREIAMLEEDLTRKLSQENKMHKEQLAALLDVDNVEDFLTLYYAINSFVQRIYFMSRYTN